jgi:small redox-active disulfide protein 2
MTTIQVLGPGCKRCAALHRATIAAADQLGLDTPVETIHDYAEMARLGVMSTPALAVDGRVLLSGSVPSVEQVRELLAGAR